MSKVTAVLTSAELASMSAADRFDVFYARADVALRLRTKGLCTRHPRYSRLSVLTDAGRAIVAEARGISRKVGGRE